MAQVYYNGIHLLNLATMVWSKAAVTGHTLPQPRCGHVAGLYDAPNRSVRMLLYGGWGVMAAPGPDVAAPRPQTPGDLPPEFAPPTICAPNNDSFAVVLAASVTPVSLKGKSLLPRISAPKGEPNSGGVRVLRLTRVGWSARARPPAPFPSVYHRARSAVATAP